MTNEKQLDQFYTQDSISSQCLSEAVEVLHKLYPSMKDILFLEPSAGDGSFIRALKSIEELKDNKYYACDVDPRANDILKRDFLKDNLHNELPDKSQVITIGNPPFGKKGKIASNFINNAFMYSETVCFILPLQFQKHSGHNQITKQAKLILDKKLKPNSFLFKQAEYSVRCCFQIWTIKRTELKDLRLRKSPITKHKDFEMWQYNNTKTAEKFFNKEVYKWDFAVPRQGYKDYTLKETNPEIMDRRTQWIFFKAKNDEILERLRKLDFVKLSQKNTSIPGFGKADVIEEYCNTYKDNSVISTSTQTFQFELPNPSLAGTFLFNSEMK